MKLMEVRNYLVARLPIEGIWFGVAKMDARKGKALCLYGAPGRMPSGVKVGGLDCTGYRQKRMMLVLRGGVDAAEAERLAFAVHEGLTADRVSVEIASAAGACAVHGFMRALDDEPYALGMDSFGVYEYRMDFEIFYEWLNRLVTK